MTLEDGKLWIASLHPWFAWINSQIRCRYLPDSPHEALQGYEQVVSHLLELFSVAARARAFIGLIS